MSRTDANNRTETFLQLLGSCELDLRSYILALVGNWNDAGDIAQQTLVCLWEQFDEFDGHDFRAWARTVAFYQVLAWRKRSQREAARMSEACFEAISAQSDEVLGQIDTRMGALRKCLGRLRSDHRELVQECYGPGASIKAVAEKRNRSVRSTQATVARLRMTLQRCIEGVLKGEERK